MKEEICFYTLAQLIIESDSGFRMKTASLHKVHVKGIQPEWRTTTFVFIPVVG